jgi:hypothetical protein
MPTVKMKIVVVGIIALLAGLGIGALAGGRSSMPNEVQVTGYVTVADFNMTNIPPLVHIDSPSSVQFLNNRCQIGISPTCASWYNSTVTNGEYSVTVPNGYRYYVSASGVNVSTGCFALPMTIPVYSYLSSINYSISFGCY